jgi:hypothetical protein
MMFLSKTSAFYVQLVHKLVLQVNSFTQNTIFGHECKKRPGLFWTGANLEAGVEILRKTGYTDHTCCR